MATVDSALTATTTKATSASFALVVREHDRGCERRRGSAHGGAGAGERAVMVALTEGAREQEAGSNRERHRADHQKRSRRSERGDVAERDPQTEQRDRPAQQRLQAEDDAGLEPFLPRQGIERDAEEKRDQHGRDRRNARDHRGACDREGRDHRR